MIFFAAVVASWIYAIATIQLAAGFPPLYVHLRDYNQSAGYRERLILALTSTIFPIFLSMGLLILGFSVQYPIVLLLAAIPPVYAGVRNRKFLSREKKLPYPLIDWIRFRFPFTGFTIDRYPMLVFDLWTVGLALFFASSILL